jgi:predicted TIM-barrel fold metal-dependent hydrolase
MIIDTHVHLAAACSARYPYAGNTIEMTKYINTLEDFVPRMNEADVAGALLVQPLAWYGFDNSYHSDSAQKLPTRLAGICAVSPLLPDARRVLRHWILERGMVGLRLSFSDGDGLGFRDDNPGLLNLLEEADDLGIPVCCMTRRANLDTVYSLSRRFPELKLVLDHLGVGLEEPEQAAISLLKLARDTNVFLKFSTYMLVAGTMYHKLLRTLLPDFGVARMMWGSDYSHTNVGGYASTVNIARRMLSDLGDSERYALFGGTALDVWPRLSGATVSAAS